MYTLPELQKKHRIFAVQFPDNNLMSAYSMYIPAIVAVQQKMSHRSTKHHDQIVFTEGVWWTCYVAETTVTPVYLHSDIKDFDRAIVFSAEPTKKPKLPLRFYVLIAIYLVGLLVASAMQSAIVAVSALGALVAASTEYISHKIDNK